MKFVIEKPSTSVAFFFRRAGYHFDKHAGEETAFARSLTGHTFPRYHAFCKTDGGRIIVNIHIDHKAASYEGSRAHSGEYDSDNRLLNEEAERIKLVAGS